MSFLSDVFRGQIALCHYLSLLSDDSNGAHMHMSIPMIVPHAGAALIYPQFVEVMTTCSKCISVVDETAPFICIKSQQYTINN